MKGLAKSVGAAAAVIAIGASPGASGQSLRRGVTRNGGPVGGTADAAGSQAMEDFDDNPSRRLEMPRSDDALDVHGTVSCACLKNG